MLLIYLPLAGPPARGSGLAFQQQAVDGVFRKLGAGGGHTGCIGKGAYKNPVPSVGTDTDGLNTGI